MDDRIDAFARLKRLHTEGVLNDEEYEREKARLMGRDPAESKPGWAESWAIGREFGKGLRRSMFPWFIASVVLILAIGAYFFIKAAAIAEARGELGGDSAAGRQLSGLDTDFGDLCLLATFMNVESLGHRVSAISDAARQAGRSISWERSGNGMIARISWTDQLANESHEMGVELVRTANAAPLPRCDGAKEGAVATRINMDGEILSGLAVGVALQQALPPRPAADSSPSDATIDSADANAVDAAAASDSNSGNQAFTPEQERLIKLNADLESECRGNPPAEEKGACAKREAAMDRLNAAGVCWGTEDQAYAEFDFHICHPGSNGYESSRQARRSSVDAM